MIWISKVVSVLKPYANGDAKITIRVPSGSGFVKGQVLTVERPEAPPPPPPPPPEPIVGDVKLRVMDGAGQRLGGVMVTRLDNGETRGTDGNGWAHFWNPDAAVYRFEAVGYVTSDRHLAPWVDEHRVHLDKALPVPGDPTAIRTGVVRLEGKTLMDDQGVWFAEGATLMPAVALVARVPAVAAADRSYLASRGIDVIRVLFEVGNNFFDAPGGGQADPWSRLTLNPRDPGWLNECAAAVDYFYEAGIRTAVTIFGGTGFSSSEAEQERTVRATVNIMVPRLHKIGWVELCNERQGFKDADDIARGRRLVSLLRSLLPANFPIAFSTSNASHANTDPTAEMEAMFKDSDANLYTPHYPRVVTTIDGYWRMVRQPWEWHPQHGLTSAIDNEPPGPGSSVVVERDTSRLVAMWITSKIANHTGRFFHTDAGVWGGQIDPAFLRNGHDDGLRGAYTLIQDEPGADEALVAMQALRAVLPPDMHTWARTRHGFPNHPFAPSFQQVGNVFTQIWPDGQTAHGVVRAYCSLRDNNFVCLLSGIRDRIDLRWTHTLQADLYACGTGAKVSEISGAIGASTVRQSIDTDIVVVGRYL